MNEPQFSLEAPLMMRARKSTLLLFVAVMLLSLPLIGGFFGRWHPAFDSMAHFRLHLAAMLMIAALPLLLSSFRLQALAALALGAGAIATVAGPLASAGAGAARAALHADGPQRAVYRLLQMNLLFDNPDPASVLSLIGRERPDVITLEEVSQMWREKLALLDSAYPYRVLCPSSSGDDGVLILSRRPLGAGSEGQCRGGSLAMVTVEFGGRDVGIGALHLQWPWPFDQSGQIDQLVVPLGLIGETALLAGDLNAVSWSAAVGRVAQASAMTLVPGIGPTWLHHSLPDALRPAGLPIDHVFAKGGVIVHSARTLEPAGSDHLPVLVEFSLLPVEPRQEHQTATALLRQ